MFAWGRQEDGEFEALLSPVAGVTDLAQGKVSFSAWVKTEVQW